MCFVFEYVVVMMFVLRCNFIGYYNDIVVGEWQCYKQFCFFMYLIGDIVGLIMGIIGSGVLG